MSDLHDLEVTKRGARYMWVCRTCDWAGIGEISRNAAVSAHARIVQLNAQRSTAGNTIPARY